ncbi:hypothetical protein PMZ80_005748 [Knufia obscura]|uniref:Uncharacterized protein n=2 Tax=Knufia TaxID=430999 RepID=A0AAN8EFF8_9EURO|nr:hypothetical protein PMZ80_005748 [Knufia obscura]KAK5954414.1 hypothetical protein OHC33_004136 [Knufia fluminis]
MTRNYKDKSQLPPNMSANPAFMAATPSPIPLPVSKVQPENAVTKNTESSEAHPRPSRTEHEQKVLCPSARLRIHLEDLSNPATARFTSIVPISTLLEEAILHVQHHLFTPPAQSKDEEDLSSSRPPQKPIKPKPEWKPQEVRSVTLILRPMDGVAYTTGTDLDEAHKEIHLNLGYLHSKLDKSNADFLHEVRGVVTHEMVHAFQHNGHGTCPGGLIEGIADYVRMKSGLGAKHWEKWPANEKTRGKKWDEGYQKTAWFLEWLEGVSREGLIGELNVAMKEGKWDEGKLFRKVTGLTVDEWWKMYTMDWEPLNLRREKKARGEICGETDATCPCDNVHLQRRPGAEKESRELHPLD